MKPVRSSARKERGYGRTAAALFAAALTTSSIGESFHGLGLRPMSLVHDSVAASSRRAAATAGVSTPSIRFAPTTVQWEGTSRVTTALAPTVAPRPMRRAEYFRARAD